MVGQPITIRNLGPEDAHILDRVAEGVFDNPIDPARAYAFLATRVNQLVVALSGGEVVGFASGTVLMHPDKPTAFFVQELGVAEPFRRQGTASRLMRRISELAWDRGCEEVWVATEAENAPANGLYRKLDGEQEDGVVVYTFHP